MKKLIATSLAVLMAVSAAIPVMTTDADAKSRHRGAKIGAGVILGAAALAAIAASSNRAYADDRGYRSSGSGYGNRCRRWARQCDRGNDYACDKYDDRC